VRLVSFDEALEQGDFFSLHMPLTPGGLCLECVCVTRCFEAAATCMRLYVC
jgi:phosphoglycerate dehydrogenase-like enzyme